MTATEEKPQSAADFYIETIQEAAVLPSDQPTWQWLEENVELDPAMTDLSGRVKFDLFPASKVFFNRLDNPRTRKATVMKCSQSAFTENATMFLLRRIKEKPVTSMWVSSTAQQSEEFAKKRLWPAIESCKVVKEISPPEEDKERWTKRLVMFDTMNLLIRGATSLSGLRSDPVGLLICDERADWKKGRINNVRQRMTTKAKPVEISIGAAGRKGDELHRDWLEGSQTLLYFKCLKCNHNQPFRLGRDETVLFPEPRACGGLVWDHDAADKKDWEAVESSTRYECEACRHRMHNIEKTKIFDTVNEHHLNPSALPHNFSLHVSALILPWPERAWGKIAVEFLKAVEEMRHGNIEPMIAFVTETLGEPWEIRNENKAKGELLERCGTYKVADGGKFSEAEYWKGADGLPEKDTTFVLTFDRQLMHLVWIIRQWRRNGQSRLVALGERPHYDDIRNLQIEWKIKNQCLWGDDGGKCTAEFRQTCARYGWQILKGEDDEHFAFRDESQKDAKTWRQGWRATEFDPGIGTVNQNRMTVTAYLWSNPWFKNLLYQIFVTAKGPHWEIPKDVSAEYLKQLLSNEWDDQKKIWKELGRVDFADCELMQLVVADIGGLTRYLPREQETKGDK